MGSKMEELNKFIMVYEDDNQPKFQDCADKLVNMVFDVMANKETIFNFAVFQVEEEQFLDLFRCRISIEEVEIFNETFEAFKNQ